MHDICVAHERVFPQMPQVLVDLEGEELESATAGVLFDILDACAGLSNRLSMLKILQTFQHTCDAQSHAGDITSAVTSPEKTSRGSAVSRDATAMSAAAIRAAEMDAAELRREHEEAVQARHQRTARRTTITCDPQLDLAHASATMTLGIQPPQQLDQHPSPEVSPFQL